MDFIQATLGWDRAAPAEIPQLDTCRALALSGGANNGAWEVGVLWSFIKEGNPEDFQYDVVSGVSVGSINGLHVAAYPKGEENQMIDDGVELWNNMTTADVYKNWLLSPAAGLITQQGFLNNDPLYRYLKNMTKDWTQLYRRLTISALNIETGIVEFFNEDTIDFKDWHHAVFSSTCIPGAFPPHEWRFNGQRSKFSDNYMLGNANPQSAINDCLKYVDDPSKITLDVLLLGQMPEFETFSADDDLDYAALGYFMRARDISYQYSNSNALTEVIRANPKVNWRYILQ